MNNDKKELLREYVEFGNIPILTDELPSKIIEEAVIINANCSNEEITGKYVESKYEPPMWYKQLEEKSKMPVQFLIIKDIDKISKEEQIKFSEILKYKKTYVNELPKNCRIIVTYSDLNNLSINAQIYSLMAHI